MLDKLIIKHNPPTSVYIETDFKLSTEAQTQNPEFNIPKTSTLPLQCCFEFVLLGQEFRLCITILFCVFQGKVLLSIPFYIYMYSG